MSIDVANSRERNPIRKDVDSILKCKGMTIETQRMWHIKTSVTNSDRGNWNYLKIIKKIPGKREMKELQKTAVLGTAHILWKLLM